MILIASLKILFTEAMVIRKCLRTEERSFKNSPIPASKKVYFVVISYVTHGKDLTDYMANKNVSAAKCKMEGTVYFNLLKPSGYFTYHQALTFKNSTCRSLCVECFVRISEQTATFALYSIN